MSKYSRLRDHLQGHADDVWHADFSDIENLLGAGLPKSAYQYREWWANDEEYHSHSKSWMKAGWRVIAVDLRDRQVTFAKNVDVKLGATVTDSRLVDVISGTFSLSWRFLGNVSIASEKLVFPRAHDNPAVYRFRVSHQSLPSHIYIGETENLRRRFYHYKNPGPRQKTSIRIHGKFHEFLRNGAVIEAFEIGDFSFSFVNGFKNCELSDAFLRRCLENIALLEPRSVEIELLNRKKEA